MTTLGPVLTDEQVVALRADYAAGATTAELVARYGASGGTVNRAARGVSYKHVPMPGKDEVAPRRGSSGGRALTDEQVIQARADYAAGVRTIVISDRLGISATTAWDAIRGATYKELPGAWTGPSRMTGQSEYRTDVVPPVGVALCSVEGCDRSASTRGMCKTHYKRMLRRGSPDGGTPIGADGRRHNQHNAPGEIGVLILFHATATPEDAERVAKVCALLPGVSVARALPATN